jgi:trehalose-6-phosphate synthase
MKVYRQIRERVDEAVGRINGRFSKLDWVPIRYFFRSLPFEEVVSHYAISDVAWITPLRDGLNMVAKEYVATKSIEGSEGVLILSEFAGAAVELHGALLTNPYDPESMAESLYRGLTLDKDDRRMRMDSLSDIVNANDIGAWGGEFLDAVGLS